MNNNQKTPVWQWMLFTALIVVFGIVAGKTYFENNILPKESGSEVTVEKSDQEIFENDKNILIQASTSGDQSLCATIHNATLKKSCEDDTQIRQAVNALDITLCESLSTEDLKTYCREKVERRKQRDDVTTQNDDVIL